MEAVHHFEGTVNQVMGDGIMALFGAPLAHEDHAVRAGYAALRMQEAIGRYAEEIRRQQGLDVQIRVGLHSGEVVVRSIGSDLRMDYTAVGQTTHLAARMDQLARPGPTLLTAATLRLVDGYAEVTPLGPVPVKGLQEPVEVYELVCAGPVRSRLQAAVARGLTRFVGRHAELEQLRQALTRAAAGQGQVVAGVGEAGVGKSRLLYEFTRSHHTHGWLLLASHSVSYGKATAYLPVIDLLKGYFGIESRDDARRLHEKVTGKLLTLDRALEPMLPALLALLEVPVEDPQWQAFDPPQRRRRTLEAVKHLLLRESQVQPLCLMFGARFREHFSLPGLPAVLSRDVLARCLAEVDAFSEGLAHGEESLRIAEAVDHPHSLINACRGIGHVYLHKGVWHQAIMWLERGLEVCRVWDIPLLLYLVSSTLGYAYVLAGRGVSAPRPLRRGAGSRSAWPGSLPRD
jgi:hypothetical protein